MTETLLLLAAVAFPSLCAMCAMCAMGSQKTAIPSPP